MDGHPTPLFADVIASVQRVIARDLGERFADEDTSVDQWRTMRTIGAAAGISMGALAEQVQIPGPSLTRLVDSLADRALVYRRQSGSDKRRIDVHLSDDGRRLLRRLESIANDHQRLVERRISPEDIRSVVATLDRIQAEFTERATVPTG